MNRDNFMERIKKLCPECKSVIPRFRKEWNRTKPGFQWITGEQDYIWFNWVSNNDCSFCKFIKEELPDLFADSLKNYKPESPFPKKPIPPKERIDITFPEKDEYKWLSILPYRYGVRV